MPALAGSAVRSRTLSALALLLAGRLRLNRPLPSLAGSGYCNSSGSSGRSENE
jgi:hypothetical protein